MIVEDQHKQGSYCEFSAKVDLSIRKPPMANTTVTDTSWSSETLSVSSSIEKKRRMKHAQCQKNTRRTKMSLILRSR